MKSVSVKELKEMIDNNEDYQLIDVREAYEYDIANIDGELIPLGTIPEHINHIAKDKKVIFHCKSGARSARAIEYLEDQTGMDNLYNLEGGILAWSDEIDASIPKY